MRRKLWQIHSWLGLGAGLGLIIIGFSGSLLLFRFELEELFNPDLIRADASGRGRLGFDHLLKTVEQTLPGYEVTGWLINDDHADTADVVYVIEHGSKEWKLATVDPYAGKVLASPRSPRSTVTGWLLDLHYEFLAGDIGLWIAGLLGVALCLLGVSGVWIYRNFWRSIFTLRLRRGSRIFFSDFHKAVGISSVAFNLLLGFTGAYWNLTHVVGELFEKEAEQPKMVGRLYPASLSLDALVRDAQRRLPSFHVGYISLPFAADGPITLWGAVEPRSRLAAPYGTTVSYDAPTSRFTAIDDQRKASVWTKIIYAFTPLHFGTFGGIAAKLIWAIGGLTPGVLATSGFFIWRSRNRGRRLRYQVSRDMERDAVR